MLYNIRLKKVLQIASLFLSLNPRLLFVHVNKKKKCCLSTTFCILDLSKAPLMHSVSPYRWYLSPTDILITFLRVKDSKTITNTLGGGVWPKSLLALLWSEPFYPMIVVFTLWLNLKFISDWFNTNANWINKTLSCIPKCIHLVIFSPLLPTYPHAYLNILSIHLRNSKVACYVIS